MNFLKTLQYLSISFTESDRSLSCVWLCDPMDYTVHGILQARMLEWVASPFSRGSSQPRDWPRSPALQVHSLPAEPQGKPKNTGVSILSLLQWIFMTQESNWGLLHCRRILYQLSYWGSPNRSLLMIYILTLKAYHITFESMQLCCWSFVLWFLEYVDSSPFLSSQDKCNPESEVCNLINMRPNYFLPRVNFVALYTERDYWITRMDKESHLHFSICKTK